MFRRTTATVWSMQRKGKSSLAFQRASRSNACPRVSKAVVAWLLSQLCAPLGLCAEHRPQDCINATRHGASRDLATFLTRPPMARATRARKGDNALVLARKLLNLVSVKGEDILLSASSEDSLRYHRLRATLPAKLWVWRTVCSWQWLGAKEHINVLQLRATLWRPSVADPEMRESQSPFGPSG